MTQRENTISFSSLSDWRRCTFFKISRTAVFHAALVLYCNAEAISPSKNGGNEVTGGARRIYLEPYIWRGILPIDKID